MFSSSTFLSFDEQELIMNEQLKNVSPGDIFLHFSMQGQWGSPLILVDVNSMRTQLIGLYFIYTEQNFAFSNYLNQTKTTIRQPEVT